MSLDLQHLPPQLSAGVERGIAFIVTVVDERFSEDHVVRVVNCRNVDDAVDMVTPYMNTNYLKSVKVRPE